ncbi:MAG: signal peptidase II [Chlamydiales bacterium]|jgi:signal peptidase II
MNFRSSPQYFGFLLYFVDLITKLGTHLYIPLMSSSSPFYPYGGIAVFENILGIEFSICHKTNTGAAWGLFSEYQFYLLAFRICLVAAMVAYLIFFNKNPAYRLPLIFIVAGAIGNITDAFIYGHVVDMFNFVLWGYNYPVFNVADSAISIGVVLLMFYTFRDNEKKFEAIG